MVGVACECLRAAKIPINDLGFLDPVELERGENRRLKTGLKDELGFVISVDAVEKGRGELGSPIGRKSCLTIAWSPWRVVVFGNEESGLSAAEDGDEVESHDELLHANPFEGSCR